MTAADVLAGFGIQRAAEVVQLAAEAGLPLAAAATMLEKESGGGHNIYGHDNVETGGNYEKGGPVTEENYRKYKANRDRFGCQGVGPTQLTFSGFQDTADARGGTYHWRVNIAVGFEVLAQGIKTGGLREGFRAYNGSDAYADDAMLKLAVWRSRLGDGGGDGGGSGSGSGGPHHQVQHAPLREGDTGPAVAALQEFLNVTFPLYSHIDLGPQRYGPQTVAVVAEFQRRAGVTGPDADGHIVGPRTWAALESFGFH